RLQGGERLGLVERREVHELVELVDHVQVEHDRAGERGAAVHDAMAHGVRAAQPVDGRVELQRVRPGGRRRQVLAAEQLVVLTEQAELQAARARVDDQDLQYGQTQSRTSSMSSPCSCVYARWRSRSSLISCRRPAARSPSPGTRSITSITRWKRSMSLSMTMSKGVVVVPSSLYPRTWMLSWFARRYVSRWMRVG